MPAAFRKIEAGPLLKLVGKRVTGIYEEQTNEFGEDNKPIVMMFDDGTMAWVMCDDEGNGPGALHVYPS